MASFVDRVALHFAAGNGGDGCATVHREKFKPLAGPDGGNGGRGDIVLEGDPQVATLLEFHSTAHRAASGKPGQGDNRTGAKGPTVLPVPNGTVVEDAEPASSSLTSRNGMRFVLAAGGQGGLGNAALAAPSEGARIRPARTAG